MRYALVYFAATMAMVAGTAAADRCTCIANGQRIAEGETFCIRPNSGDPFLARCEIVLNNTSWRKLQDGCPTARLDTGKTVRPWLILRPS